MRSILLAIRADGSAELLAGPEVRVSEQRNAVLAFRAKGLPEGIVRVEMWERRVIKAASQPAEEAAPKSKPAKKPKSKPAKKSE